MDELREKVDALIEKYRDDAEFTHQQSFNRLVIIKKLLENPRCFFEISVEQAASILRDLEVEDVEGCYKKLISMENWIEKKEQPLV